MLYYFIQRLFVIINSGTHSLVYCVGEVASRSQWIGSGWKVILVWEIICWKIIIMIVNSEPDLTVYGKNKDILTFK